MEWNVNFTEKQQHCSSRKGYIILFLCSLIKVMDWTLSFCSFGACMFTRIRVLLIRCAYIDGRMFGTSKRLYTGGMEWLGSTCHLYVHLFLN